MVTWVKETRLADARARALVDELATTFADKGTTALARGKRQIDKKTRDLRDQRQDRSVRVIHD